MHWPWWYNWNTVENTVKHNTINHLIFVSYILLESLFQQLSSEFSHTVMHGHKLGRALPPPPKEAARPPSGKYFSNHLWYNFKSYQPGIEECLWKHLCRKRENTVKQYLSPTDRLRGGGGLLFLHCLSGTLIFVRHNSYIYWWISIQFDTDNICSDKSKVKVTLQVKCWNSFEKAFLAWISCWWNVLSFPICFLPHQR